MIELRTVAGGVLLPVKAQPGSRKNAVLGERAGALLVSITAAPEKGKANAALIDVLADALDLRPTSINLVRGAASPQKTFLIAEVDEITIRERLASLVT